MKKAYLILFSSLVSLFLFTGSAKAYAPGCTANNGTTDPAAWNSTTNKPIGLVPCGISIEKASTYTCVFKNNSTGEQIEEQISITGNRNDAEATTQCQGEATQTVTYVATRYIGTFEGIPNCPCELGHLGMMILRIYNFAVWILAIPFAALMVVIGGLLLLISGGNPGWADKGKKILIYSGISLLLIFGSWLIIDVVLKAIGYVLPWSSF